MSILWPRSPISAAAELLLPNYTAIGDRVERVCETRLHDTTGCQTGCQTGLTTGLTTVLNEQLFVQHGCQTELHNRFDNSSRISRVDTHFPQKLPFDLYLTFILIHFNVYRRSQ